MLYYLVLTVHFIVALFLILVVLLQSGRSGDLASAFGGGGGSQSVFGPRGTGSVLTKATEWSAVIFMVTSISLVLLSQTTSGSRIKDEGAAPPPAQSAPASTAPTSPADGAPAPPAGSQPQGN
ncbi:MAG: preprotein translocase subunit SecG [Acidobacteriota bacterium]